MPIRRAFFLLSSGAGVVALALACGGIKDPNLSVDNVHVATISGALTGTAAPSAARVALVWRTGKAGGYAVGADVPVEGGRFSMTLDAPPDSYFVDESGDSDPVVAPGKLPAPSGSGSGAPSTGSGGADDAGTTTSRSIGIKDTAGGQITAPFTVAVAGFVVYADANGNGQLDIAAGGTSVDTLLGGNSELFIADLRGGGSLDYEKLRDKSGILPAQGFNLAWTQERWLPLDEVELKLTSTPHLPAPVCSSGGSSVDEPPSVVPLTPPNVGSSGSGYPSPDDPKLHCAADGRSWRYDPSCPPPPPPPPPGLCTYNTIGDVACAGIAGSSLAPGAPVPTGWPCKVSDADAGLSDDASASKDASAG